MSHRVLIIFSFIFLYSFAIRATSGEHEFIGTIQLIDKSIISYKINFTESDDGRLTGYSLTDFSGEHKTKTKIRGRVDRAKRTISFSETENVLTKSSSDTEDFCYLHVYNAKIKLAKKKSYIQGHFFSRYDDGSLCIEGDIYLIGQDQFFRKMDRAIAVADKIKKGDQMIQVKENIVKTKESMKNTVLNNGSKVVIPETNGQEVIVRIFDTEYLDGDKISIFNNDICILDNYKVTGKTYQLPIIIQDTTILRIVANNEGRYPPNSAQIEIMVKDESIPIKLNMLKGNQAEIQFIGK